MSEKVEDVRSLLFQSYLLFSLVSLSRTERRKYSHLRGLESENFDFYFLKKTQTDQSTIKTVN